MPAKRSGCCSQERQGWEFNAGKLNRSSGKISCSLRTMVKAGLSLDQGGDIASCAGRWRAILALGPRGPVPTPADPGPHTRRRRPARLRRGPGAAELMASRSRPSPAAALLATRSVMLAVVAASPLALLPAAARALTPHEALELLGKHVFFDTSLSTPGNNQACASCHDPAKGWILPNSEINRTIVVAPGAKRRRLGSIKTPMNAYASFSPPFTLRVRCRSRPRRAGCSGTVGRGLRGRVCRVPWRRGGRRTDHAGGSASGQRAGFQNLPRPPRPIKP